MKQILLIAALFQTIFSSAQISGRVTDAQTGEPLAGVTVQGKTTALTNEKGLFTLDGSEGTTITISLTGYETVTRKAGRGFITIALQRNTLVLGEVVVSAYEGKRKLLETSGAVTVLGKKDLNHGDGISIVNVINQSPGVRMDFYTTNDYRVSIRGSSMAQPSVHDGGYKMYWNDIPYSPASGTSSLGNFDVSSLNNIEIIRGPASSLYGGGFGGVLLLQSDKAVKGENSVAIEAQAGSYHTGRITTQVKLSGDKTSVYGQFTSLKSDGYREGTFANAKYGNVYAQFYGARSVISVLATYNYRRTGIAGNLTKEQVEENPRQSLMLPSEGFGPEFAGIGVNNKYTFNEKWQNSVSAYYENNYGEIFTMKDPYFSIYEKYNGSNLTFRNTVTYKDDRGTIQSRIVFGIEHIHSGGKAMDYDGGFDQPLLSLNGASATSAIGFAQGEFTFPQSWILTAGASYNAFYYQIRSHISPSYFSNPVSNFSPRIALLKKITENTSAYASFSKGFDPPSSSDFNNYDGTYNKDIQPTKGNNTEIGFRSSLFSHKLYVDIAAYQANLTNALIPVLYNPSAGVSIERKANAGKVRQQGIEASIAYSILSAGSGFIKDAGVRLNYTYNNYSYTNFVTVKDNGSGPESADYSGKKVPGINPHTVVGNVDIYTAPGFYFTASAFYYGKQFLTHDNTISFKDYSLLNLKAGYNKRIVARWELNVYAGINNATSTSYSGLLAYNDAYGAYYNPAATANYYGGLGLKFHF